MPRNPRYFSGWGRPTSSICVSMLVTIISSRFCQRDRFESVERLRVTSLEPTTSTSITAQVNTMVPLSLKNPRRQKIIWSALRCMASLLRRSGVGFTRWPRQPRHGRLVKGRIRRDRRAAARMARADDVESARGQRRSAAASWRRTTAQAGWPRRPCEPSTRDRRRRGAETDARHAGQRQRFTPSSSSAIASSSLATQCHALKQPITSPATRSASVQGCLPACRVSSQCPSAAPSSVGIATDQPTSPIMPRPNQTP